MVSKIYKELSRLNLKSNAIFKMGKRTRMCSEIQKGENDIAPLLNNIKKGLTES